MRVIILIGVPLLLFHTEISLGASFVYSVLVYLLYRIILMPRQVTFLDSAEEAAKRDKEHQDHE